jgi:arylsulfatase A-like enzyme
MKSKNVILLTFDELRADHVGCYGYKRIRTDHFDWVADKGILFENCISASNLTPICHAALLSGMNPNRSGVRDPYSFLLAKPISEILKGEGYKTAGFVGSGILGSRHGFSKGFDTFYEPTAEEAVEILRWENDTDHQGLGFPLGGWWIDQMLAWLDQNRESKFFIFGHFFHTHEGMGESLVKDGRLKEGELSEFDYLDAKVKLADESVVGPVLERLKQWNLMDDTILILTSDHGTNLGEHGGEWIPGRQGQLYPQHRSLYHHDIRVLLIIKGLSAPSGQRIRGIVRHIDVVPTLLSELDIPCDFQFDGINLTPFIEAGEPPDLQAYSEALYDVRPPGAIQSFYSAKYKFIRNLTKGVEEFFRLEKDPKETINLIADVSDEERNMLVETRRKMNKMLMAKREEAKFSEKERAEIEGRLKMLGYIK